MTINTLRIADTDLNQSPTIGMQGRSENHPLFKAFDAVEYGQLTIHTPNRNLEIFSAPNPGPTVELQLHSWTALDALLARGEIGFAESYIAGEWDSPNLASLLTFGLMNADSLERYFYGKPAYALWVKFKHMFRANSLSGSKRNILKHYDLGNDFYSLWLDDSMTYSCGLFEGSTTRTLEEAQQAKYSRILSHLNGAPGNHILEIGCGWGGFAEAAAKQGYAVTAVTISAAQKAYVEARIQEQNLQRQVTVRLQDYRKVKDKFDHIVSIGMFEHVGEQYWPSYFQHIRDHLHDGGNAMIQTITLDDDVFERTRGKVGFIEEYIFPGGELPSPSRFRLCAEEAGLKVHEMYGFGQDYAITLTHWLNRFESRKAEIKWMGYDEHFIRMWRFYLASCIASFMSKRSNVMQVKLSV